MVVEVVEARPLEVLKLRLRFSDGKEGVVDLSALELPGLLSRLRDPGFFAQVRVEFPLLFPSIPPGFGAGRESPSGKGSSPTPAPGRHSFRPVSRVSALTRGETSPHTSAEAGEGSPFSG